MKRFLIFIGDVFYPELGMRNFIGDSETIEEAHNLISDYHKKSEDKSEKCEQIYDTINREVVFSLNESYFEI